MYKSLWAAAMLMALPASIARADVFFDWSYSGVYVSGPSAGAPVSGSGQLDTQLSGAPGLYPITYDVVGISGTANGSAITGLTDYAQNDNLFYYGNGPGTTFLDFPGVAFTVAGGDAFNFYYNFGTTVPPGAYDCGYVGYCLIGPGVVGTDGLGPPEDALAQITFTATLVPEPATWAMMLLGLAGLGLAANRRSSRSLARLASR